MLLICIKKPVETIVGPLIAGASIELIMTTFSGVADMCRKPIATIVGPLIAIARILPDYDNIFRCC